MADRPSFPGGGGWVNDEVAYWVTGASKPPEQILLARTSGSVVWDQSGRDFAWTSTSVVPALRGTFREEPRIIDLADLREKRWFVGRRQFRRAVREIAAKIHDLPADLLEGAHRSSVRIVRAGLAVLTSLVVIAGALVVVSIERGRETGEQRSVAAANAMASAAQDRVATDIDTGLLMAVEAWKLRDTPETRAALLAGLARHRHLEQVIRLEEPAHRVALSPDETRLAVFSLDQRLHVWDLEARGVVSQTDVDQFIERLAFDHSGDRLMSVSPEFDPTAPNRLQVRTVDRLDDVAFSTDLPSAPRDIEFGLGESQLLVAHDGGVDTVDMGSGAVERLLDTPTTDVSVDDGGLTMAAATGGLAQVWDLDQRRGIEELELGEQIRSVTISGDGRFVGFGADTSIGYWDRPAGTFLPTGDPLPPAGSAAPRPDGAGVTAALTSGDVVTWTGVTAPVVHIDVGGKPEVEAPVVGRSGRRVAVAQERIVTVWRTDRAFPIARELAPEDLQRWQGIPLVSDVDFDDEEHLLVAEPDRLILWDTTTEPAEPITSIEEITACAATVGPSDAEIVTVEPSDAAPGRLEVTHRPMSSPRDARASHDLDGRGCEEEAVTLSDGGRLVAIGPTIRDADSCNEIASLGASVIDTAFSDDGRQFLTTSNQAISVLDLDDEEARRYDTGQTVWGVAQGPLGTIATGTGDHGGVTLWTSDFRVWGSLPRHHLGSEEPAGEAPVVDLAFSRDGDALATATELGSIVIWDTDPRSWLDAACDIANRALNDAELEELADIAPRSFEPANPCAEPAEG